MSTATAMTTDIHELSNRQALLIGYFIYALLGDKKLLSNE